MIRGMAPGFAGIPMTYATWNPADKGANVALSNGNRTLTTSAGGNVRSTIPIASGKVYWEVTCNAVGAGSPSVGVEYSTAPLTSYVGFSADQWGYLSSSGNRFHVTVGGYGSAWGAGAVIGVALDMVSGNITFYLNGVSQGVAYAGQGFTSIFAAAGSNDAGAVFTVNFGATAFAYSVPSGYNAGLYI